MSYNCKTKTRILLVMRESKWYFVWWVSHNYWPQVPTGKKICPLHKTHLQIPCAKILVQWQLCQNHNGKFPSTLPDALPPWCAKPFWEQKYFVDLFYLVGQFSDIFLTRAALGSPAERAALGGVNITPPLCLTHEPAVVARLARRQSKALNEYFSRKFWKFS